MSIATEDHTREQVIDLLARIMYAHYCERRGTSVFQRKSGKYVPAWARDYAAVAVDWLGFDEDPQLVEDMREEVQESWQ